MAYDFNLVNDNSTALLSKIKVGNSYYYLKDADARAILNTYNNAITTGTIASSISSTSGTGFATEGLVKSYVDAQVGAINKFDVEVVSTLPTASANTMYIIYLVPASEEGVSQNAKKEYITIRSGEEGEYTYAWELIGDTALDLTNYLSTAATVAGVSFGSGKAISKADLQEALELGALAYKDSASGSVDDYATGITGATYTPAGSVTVTAGTAAAATYDKTTGVTVTATADDEGNYTPAGTVTVTPSTATVATVTNNGTAYTITEGSVTQGNDTTSAFTTEGVVTEVGTGADAETLIFTAAGTGNAVTASGTVSYTAPTLSGALPTFGTQSVVDGITSASFTGTKVEIEATPTHTGTAATVTQPTFTGSFSGTEATITPTLTTGNKTITVS